MRFTIPLATLLAVASASCDVFRLRVAHSGYAHLLSGQYLTNQTLDSNATMSAKYATTITAKSVANTTELLIPGYDRLCLEPSGRVGFRCVPGGQGNSTGWKLRQHELGNLIVHGDAEDEGWVSAPRLPKGKVDVVWEIYWGKHGVSGPGMKGYDFKLVQECV